ncbi:IclR family transcriptional regulator [Bacillaceae bacterium]
MEAEKSNKEYLLSSVKNALRILRSFSMDEPEKKISDLAVSLGISKSAVSRLMSTLASEGFVTKDPETHRYRLGVSVLALSSIVTSHLELHREALPVLQRLVEQTGETAHIVVLEGLEVVYLHKVECKNPIRIFTYIGKRNPAYCTSSGKAILAYQEEEVIARIIENGLKPHASNTITDPAVFRACLQKVREQGYASSMSEILEGVTSVAAPIRDYTGKVIAAVSVVGPSHRIHPKEIPHLAKKVVHASREISERLGYWK